MSAACAPAAAPSITAASRNLRIAPLHQTLQPGADHRLLTLTNRCRRAAIGMILSRKAKSIFESHACRARQNGAGRSCAVKKS
jgi:hypothetical protein